METLPNSKIIEILDYWNFWNRLRNTGIARTKYVDELFRQRNIKEVSIVAGIRRSGKSTILLQVLQKIIKSGVPKENTLAVNFEEPAFSGCLDVALLLKIYDAYLEKFSPKGKIFVVLDEVQMLSGWEKFVRGLYDRGENIKFYITGSSSRLLSAEFGSVLTGRIYSNEIFPLSFKEFLQFKEQDRLLAGFTGKGSPALRNLFTQYMQFGGFPQIVLTPEEQDKIGLLKDYYSAIMEKDIVQRYSVRDVKKLKEFCLNLITNIAAPFSGYKSSKNQQISQPTANKFLQYVEEVFLVQKTDFFSYSFTRQKGNPHKIYVIDPGLYQAVAFRFSENLGKIFENMVYMEYRRRGQEIFYWKGKHEVDFMIREGTKITRLINVCWELTAENRERETAGLWEAMEEFNLQEAEIITAGYEEKITHGKRRINVKNFLKNVI